MGCSAAQQSALIKSPAEDPAVVTSAAQLPKSAITPAVKKRRCGMSPPIYDRKKILQMLILEGKIERDLPTEEQDQLVVLYINKKQQAFNKKCR